MPGNLLWNVRMYLRLLTVQIRSQMTYRLSFWMDVFSTAGNAIFFLAFALVLQRFGGIAGWSLGEIAFIYGMIEASFGLMDMIFSGFDPDFFAENTRSGAFDQVLLRPVGVTWQVLGSKFLLRRLGRIFEGLAIFLWALTLVDVAWTPEKLLYLPVVFFSQVIAMGALFIAGSALTFWTIERIEAVNILTYGGSEMMSYPMHIYPAWMQKAFTFVVPFIFLNYYPALYFLGKPDPLGFPVFAPFLAPFVAVLFYAAALWFWRVGIDHYQSAGS
jgi:ABC-2 type transport system permease protein